MQDEKKIYSQIDEIRLLNKQKRDQKLKELQEKIKIIYENIEKEKKK